MRFYKKITADKTKLNNFFIWISINQESSAAGTNSQLNSTTAGLNKESKFAKTLSWKGANDQDRNKKRSNDVAYGSWVPDKSKQEVKTEFDNDLGVSVLL